MLREGQRRAASPAPEPEPDPDRLLTPAQVAERFGVHTRTVARWADEGQIDAYKTLGGHRRYRAGDVERLARRYDRG